MPATVAFKLRYYYSMYESWRSYATAGRQNATVPWMQRNPEMAEMVTSVIAARKEKKRAG